VLRRGRRVRAVLTQGPLVTIPVGEQLAALAAVVGGAFDRVPPTRVRAAEDALRHAARSEHADLLAALDEGGAWQDDDRERLVATAARIALDFADEGEGADGDA
jgi:F0F1-type ATP synthase alpha subunit